jgi:hypothetical protein
MPTRAEAASSIWPHLPMQKVEPQARRQPTSPLGLVPCTPITYRSRRRQRQGFSRHLRRSRIFGRTSTRKRRGSGA